METHSRYRLRLLPAVAMLAAVGIAFHIWQNLHGQVGGSISPAKSLWLVTALGCFYLVPAWLAWDPNLSASERRKYKVFFYGFLIRAFIELPVLLFTREWRCWHGISHNLVMLALLWGMRRRPDQSRFELPLTLVLLAESLNAWLFSVSGDPESGIYFANNSARFAQINLITWTELAILLPLLGAWMWSYMKGGMRREPAL